MKNIIVKKARKKGYGIFALKGFKKGDFVLEILPGRVLSEKEAKRVPKKDSGHLDRWDKSHYYFMNYPEYYINHSCEPNVFVKNGKFYAIKNIKKGEEITSDYSINGIENWKMRCSCGEKNCRKIIYGNFFKLPKPLQKRYYPYLNSWFKKGYRKKLK